MIPIKNTGSDLTPRAFTTSRNPLRVLLHALCLIGLLGMMHSASASTTITSGSTFTIDDSNVTRVGFLTTWNDTGTLTIHSGGTLLTWPTQNREVANNDNIVFTGTGGTVTLNFNNNDTDNTLNGSISSTATGAQTLAINTGSNGNGDRGSVTIHSGIPDVADGSPMSLQLNYRTQSGAANYISLPGVNTFTGPISFSKVEPVAFSYLTIGGVRFQNVNVNVTTPGTGSLGGGNYPGDISLNDTSIFNYLSSANQILSGAISGAGRLDIGGGGTVTLSGASTFSGNTTVSGGSALVLGTPGNYTFYLTNSETNKITGGGSATLNGSFTVDTSAVTATSGSWTLVDTTSKSFGAGFGLANFTGPVGDVYTRSVAGQDWTFDKSTGVLSLSTKAIITSFGIPGADGVIDQNAKTISLTVPYTPWASSGLSALAPTFSLTTGTCNQTSGSAPSPTFAVANPATYTCTDGSTVNSYTVTVTITPASSASDILGCDFGALGSAAISGTDVVLTVSPDQSRNPLSPTFTLSPNATINPASGSAQDFTGTVTYRVTAEDGTTFKDYTVAVLSYEAWTHSGSFFILTTPDGADIPAGAAETDFPLLVRLDSGNFNFGEAEPDGRDIRFTSTGAVLSYQIEEWNAATGTASIWVKIPSITGNSSTEINMYWGNSSAASESDGSAVFNASNGYASVIHMNDGLEDEIGSVTPANVGTTDASGLIGRGRHFATGQGVNCGSNITSFPSGSGANSSQAWIRAEAANSTVLAWGFQQPQSKVVMSLLSPPLIRVDSWQGGGDVIGATPVPLNEWVHIVHTNQGSEAKLYINGVLDTSNTNGSMNIPSTVRMTIGSNFWQGYKYQGDIDEVRISNVVRSANWVKLEYENQKPLQTLLGNIVQSGSTFSAAPSSVTIDEGTSTTLTGQAGGAQKVYWILKKDGQETILATDQFSLDISAGRVTGNQNYVIQFKGIYPGGNQTIDIPITITENILDPEFTLTAPAVWNGRDTITVTPVISNLAALQASGADSFSYSWTVNGVAVIKEITPGVLTLLRSQGSGPMTVTLVMDNGGASVSNSTIITVQEPATDALIQRTPGANEKPVDMQFFARDLATGLGTIHYNGTQGGSPDDVFLKIYTTDSGDVLYATHRQALAGSNYAFSVPIAAGKVTYKVVYGTRTGGIDTPLATVSNLICGDAFIIEGQSNALATDNAVPNDPTTDPWIRSYGLTSGWGGAVIKGGDMQLGVWGWYLANRLSTDQNMPICIINGAVGGTRIDQHMPNPADHSLANGSDSIYANLYNRVTGANLTHGIRAVLWHQGENNQGANGPDADYDYKFYQQYFVDMTAAWKQDFPNILNYYVFQIWPAACGDQSRNDQLREVQRTLPFLFSNMKILSTLGINPGASCHYTAAGYQVFSDLIGPLIEQDTYGLFTSSVYTAANLKKAYFTTAAQDAIVLEFDQDMPAWDSGSNGLFFLDGVVGQVSSGSVSGKVVTLQLSAPSAAATITYLKGKAWNGVQTDLVYGANGIAALTFADVPIAAALPASSSYSDWAADLAQGLTAGVNDGPLDDPDHDSIVNLLEFVLGGDPLVPSSATLPTVSHPGGGTWFFEYERSNLSVSPATTQVVEYSSDLVGWTQVPIPAASAGTVTITSGSPSDHVSVAIPDLGSAGFARLKVSE